jgi:hypothetical protein
VLGEQGEIRAIRVERVVRAAHASQAARRSAMQLVPRARGITRALHEQSSVLIHALAQIGKHRIGISYLDESKAGVFEVDDHACAIMDQLRNYIHRSASKRECDLTLT